MPFAAALSEHPRAAPATGEVVGRILEQLGPAPDLVVLAVSAAHIPEVGDIAATVQRLLEPGALIGTVAHGVLAGPREVEGHPAVALWAARFGPVTAHHVHTARGAGGDLLPGLDLAPGHGATAALVLGGPPGFDPGRAAAVLGRAAPAIDIIGAMAARVAGAPGALVVVDGEVHATGAAMVLLGAAQAPAIAVAHGATPVGDPLVVTRADGEVVLEIAGVSALARLDAAGAVPDPLAVAPGAGSAGGGRPQVLLGVAIDELRHELGRGDFVLHEPVGVDRARGGVLIGRPVEVGTTVQFHVRDAAAADEDLRTVLTGHRGDAALVFAGAARGVRLFGAPDHDADLVGAVAGGDAVGGVFCAAPLGPGAGGAELSSSAVSVALFCDR